MEIEPKKILILGGYGKAGKQIASLLAVHTSHTIFIGGRNFAKAEQCTQELLRKFPDKHLEPVKVNANNLEELIAATKNINMVVVCIPLSRQSTLNIIDAVLKSNNAAYIDLSPGEEKHAAFKEAAEKIKLSNKLYILDAGFDPGLPSFLSYLAASLNSNPLSLKVEAIYKDPDIGKSGIQDILNHRKTSKIYIKGQWKQVSSFSLKEADFPKPFGKTLAVPICLPELEGLPQVFDLKHVAMYHAGMNVIANIVLFAWKSGLHRILPSFFGINLFQWATRNFTQPPFGGMVKVTVTGAKDRIVVTAYHENLYLATAIPVVATVKQVLERDYSSGSYHFMGQWVSKEGFVKALREMGLQVQVQLISI